MLLLKATQQYVNNKLLQAMHIIIMFCNESYTQYYCVLQYSERRETSLDKREPCGYYTGTIYGFFSLLAEQYNIPSCVFRRRYHESANGRFLQTPHVRSRGFIPTTTTVQCIIII